LITGAGSPDVLNSGPYFVVDEGLLTPEEE